MGGDDVPGPGQPEPSGKTDQEIFDEQVARASGNTVVIFGGLGILAALVMSTIALVNSTGGNSTTVTVPAAPAAGQALLRRKGTPYGTFPAYRRLSRRSRCRVSRNTRPMKCPMRGRGTGHHTTPGFKRKRARRPPTPALLPRTTSRRGGRDFCFSTKAALCSASTMLTAHPAARHAITGSSP